MRRSSRYLMIILGLAGLVLAAGLGLHSVTRILTLLAGAQSPLDRNAHKDLLVPPGQLTPFQAALMADLDRQVKAHIVYRDGYYMGGDPPPQLGVCTDVVVRSFRAAGVDLQGAVTADIRRRPSAYGIARPDPNIDHRRCRNLIIYFRRHARSLPTSDGSDDWQPGDVVFWDTSGDGAAHHVGMIANGRDKTGAPTIVHHWPGLPVSETDGLFSWRIVGHYRWTPARAAASNAKSGRPLPASRTLRIT
jgi:uncharacterized protein YijF (DUF1287 family)